jgi:hypothetical protein
MVICYFPHLFLSLCFCIHFTFLLSLTLIYVLVSLFKVARLYFYFFCFQVHSVLFCWLSAVQTALCLLIMRMGLCRNFDRVILSLICVVSTPQVLKQCKIFFNSHFILQLPVGTNSMPNCFKFASLPTSECKHRSIKTVTHST